MFRKKQGLAPANEVAFDPPPRVEIVPDFARINEFDEVSIFKSGRWCSTDTRWTCTLKMGNRESGEIKFTADAPTMKAAIATALAKADAARRRLG